ncbi:hypothetical protein [Sphingobacterium hotanense]|uniref:hypothetical protein n=1 Tax=Sphingobacterium hotanense TaxID=649196 RepID=UPI0011F3146B|nr:hypothetical protein [Sphingobacterium hotanense]
MEYLNKIIELINPVTTRPYKGGIELRGLNLDTTKDEIQSVIQANGWPVEIFDVDVRLKSVSIREK